MNNERGMRTSGEESYVIFINVHRYIDTIYLVKERISGQIGGEGSKPNVILKNTNSVV